MNNDIILTISSIVTPVLLGIVSFFIRSLYSRFAELEKEVKQLLIKHENFEQRILNLERRISEMQNHIEALQRQLWEAIKK